MSSFSFRPSDDQDPPTDSDEAVFMEDIDVKVPDEDEDGEEVKEKAPVVPSDVGNELSDLEEAAKQFAEADRMRDLEELRETDEEYI